ncbi:SDR family NAD(P)-dependent oxidoreductase [Planctopirus hydrillae]|uniref:Oxidoreductase n=1 Tax=Planctopirus hydrillae TaxID=1841610 RepID=A0A1C3EDE7_9PLAN|nr:SDR family oxidoreductase [Planctopirus hydrillae]ODA31255.1 oxidoreductase [Planctopirus hydrillae]
MSATDPVVILGATGGIGTALARRLHAVGTPVFLAARDPEKLQVLMSELDAPGQVVDVLQAGEIEAACQKAASATGSLSGIANCVGSLILKPAHLTTDQELMNTLMLHIGSSLAVVRAAAKLMRGTGGSIVLVSSAAARIGLANHEAIAAAKGGIQGLALSAAATYANKNIRVNVVAPGLVRTPLTQKIWQSAASEAMSAQMHALGRIGEPDDVASLMQWLLDPAQTWVTGQIFGIDGGLGVIAPRPKQSAG